MAQHADYSKVFDDRDDIATDSAGALTERQQTPADDTASLRQDEPNNNDAIPNTQLETNDIGQSPPKRIRLSSPDQRSETDAGSVDYEHYEHEDDEMDCRDSNGVADALLTLAA